MESILQGLMELEGVLAVLVFRGRGQLYAFRTHPVYTAEWLEQIRPSIVNTLDTLLLLDEAWEGVSLQFTEGRLFLRNLGGSHAQASYLVVVADASINPNFGGVAIRMAASRLKGALAGGPTSDLGGGPVAPAPLPEPPKTPVVADSGLSWSGIGGSSSMAASGVSVVDAASAAYLTQITRALAMSVGPMAKVFVKEAVRKLMPGQPFSRAQSHELEKVLEGHIEDAADLQQFRKTMLGA